MKITGRCLSWTNTTFLIMFRKCQQILVALKKILPLLKDLLQKSCKKARPEASVVDVLLDIYEEKKDEKKLLLLCEKEFEYSYFRYIEYLESKGQIDEAIQCCTRAQDFAKGFLKTDLVEKMAELRHTCGDNNESLSLYIKSFKDRPEEELLEKITHLSNELGLWKDVKKELTSWRRYP